MQKKLSPAPVILHAASQPPLVAKLLAFCLPTTWDISDQFALVNSAMRQLVVEVCSSVIKVTACGL